MANTPNQHRRVAMCGRNPLLHLGTTTTGVPKILKTSGSMLGLCLDKAVLAQGGGGYIKGGGGGSPIRTLTHPKTISGPKTWLRQNQI